MNTTWATQPRATAGMLKMAASKMSPPRIEGSRLGYRDWQLNHFIIAILELFLLLADGPYAFDWRRISCRGGRTGAQMALTHVCIT